MVTSNSQLKAVKKYEQSKKGKITKAKYDSKRDKAQIDGITKSTKALFVSKKESLGLTAEQFLLKLLC